jgi:hypothetical protein
MRRQLLLYIRLDAIRHLNASRAPISRVYLAAHQPLALQAIDNAWILFFHPTFTLSVSLPDPI